MANSKKPLISVIITVKNVEEHLKECLKSITEQTLKDLEIVTVYAESKDNTLQILKDFQKKDKRLKIYDQDRPGIGAAKNCGIKNSIGEYITFLDGDDYYLDKNALEKMYNGAKEHNVKVCGALRKVLTMNGELEEITLHRPFLVGFPKGRLFYYKDVQYDYHFHSYIYDREMIMSCGARFAETRAYDDTHFFVRAMLAAERFYVVPVELYCYRCHESYSWSSSVCYEALQSLIDELRFAKENHLYNLYYMVIQRINYEYGPQFENHIRHGYFKLLELLLDLQKEVDNEILYSVVKRMPTSCIIDAMNFPNYGLKTMCIKGEDYFILTPLYNLINNQINEKSIDYKEAYCGLYNSKTFKVGRLVLWLPKKILTLLHLK
ncbi:MAG: glycosyltransferase family 2 protein [Bacilli bacterium]|nr:glycosyltransferase family 2 protein [Bacilli bacterium]